jgi:hypothetical protein
VVETTELNDSSANTDWALIGGVVGGLVALLLVGGIVAAVVLSRRRDESASKEAMSGSVSAMSMTPASTMDIDTMQRYSEPSDVRSGAIDSETARYCEPSDVRNKLQF